MIEKWAKKKRKIVTEKEMVLSIWKMPNFSDDIKRDKIKENTSFYWQRLKAKHLLVWYSRLCPRRIKFGCTHQN